MPEKLSSISDFTARLGERLTHFQRHQQRQVGHPFMQQLERAHQNVGTLTRRARREGGLGAHRGVQCSATVLGRSVGDGAQRGTRGRIDDIEGPPTCRVDPLAVDEQPFSDGPDHSRLIHYATPLPGRPPHPLDC